MKVETTTYLRRRGSVLSDNPDVIYKPTVSTTVSYVPEVGECSFQFNEYRGRRGNNRWVSMRTYTLQELS